MSLGLVGRKVGMMRIFTEDGDAVPVTVLDVSNNRVAQIKSVDNDGYTAVQVAFGERKASRVNKSQAGHLAKAGIEAGSVMREFRAADQDLEVLREKVGGDLKAGVVLPVAIFSAGDKVDVAGTTQGKGFSGVIKRHNFSSNRASHGNSVSHNKPGSIGQAQDPGRVFPGKKMAGQLGNVRRTVQNLVVARVDADRGLLLVRGAVPGHVNGSVIVTRAIKTPLGKGGQPVVKAQPAAGGKK
jgi:large subunit ribosomal protein L3